MYNGKYSAMRSTLICKRLCSPLKSYFSTRCISLSSQRFIHKKPILSEKQLFKKFVDEKRVKVVAGKGGDGRSCFLRDKISAYGGPSGGNGGKGGDVIFVSDDSIKSLENIQSVYFAENGKDGGSGDAYGKNGKNLYVSVPVGTLVRCDETGEVMADFFKANQSSLICAGGTGGLGNKFFVCSTNTTPEECTPGLTGERMVIWVEVRTLAHAGIVGFPNAGKSTLLRSLTKAKPAVEAYAFTTLVPHVGILHFEDFTQIAIADTPGIIDGAHLNKGRGIRFLKHIERCRFLVYVIDLSLPKPWEELYKILIEFEHFEASLSERPGIVLGNKIDLPEAKKNYPLFKERVEELNLGFDILPISGKMWIYMENLIIKIREKYDEDAKKRKKYGKTIALEW